MSPPRPVPSAIAEADLPVIVAELAARDADLAAIHARFGLPPLWARPPGFPTLVHLVLEQQVSLASAKAAFDRLVAATDPLTPAALLRLDDAALLAIGFSRQKTRYARALAQAVHSGSLDLPALAAADDDEVDRRLTALPGIGPWTATIYRLMVLGRPDAWPVHDIAIAQAIAEVRGLARRPGPAELETMAEAWRPYRAVAARLLWHHYLSVRAERRAAAESLRAEPRAAAESLRAERRAAAESVRAERRAAAESVRAERRAAARSTPAECRTGAESTRAARRAASSR